MEQAAQTIGNFLSLILIAFVGSLLTNGGLFISMMRQRKVVSNAATKIDESARRQQEANDLLRKTLTDALEVKNSVIEDDRREIASLKKDVANYKEALDSTLKEVDAMRGDLRQMRFEHDAQIRELRGEIDSLKKELTEKDRQLTALTKAVQDREDLVATQVQKIHRFEMALAEKDAALVEAQTLISTLRQNETRTAEQLDQLRERVRNLETQVAKLNAERDLLIAERDAARREAEAARVETAAAKQKEFQLLQRIEYLETRIRELETVKAEGTPINERPAEPPAAEAAQ